MLSKKLLAVLGLLLMGSPLRAADDTVVTLAAGGLVPGGPTAVRMESEDVEITTRRITIRYVFRNPTDQDQPTSFAFRLPDLDGMGLCFSPYLLPRKNEINFVGFGMMSKGQPIPTQVEVRAIREGQDVTPRLTEAGLRPTVLLVPLNAALLRMQPEQVEKLEAEGLIEPHKFGAPLQIIDKNRGWCATWAMRVAYSWTQMIPANEAIELTQIYSPVVGGGFYTATNDGSAYVANYCAASETMRAISTLRSEAAESKDSGTLLYEQAIDFTLTSANAWNAPIGNFHLSVLTKDPNDMVMTCMAGLQNTAPGKYELQKTDYQPGSDLRLMILQKSKPWGL